MYVCARDSDNKTTSRQPLKMCSQRESHTLTHAHTGTQAHTHRHTRTHTHAPHTHTTHTHTHTHTHTETHSLRCLPAYSVMSWSTTAHRHGQSHATLVSCSRAASREVLLCVVGPRGTGCVVRTAGRLYSAPPRQDKTSTNVKC